MRRIQDLQARERAVERDLKTNRNKKLQSLLKIELEYLRNAIKEERKNDGSDYNYLTPGTLNLVGEGVGTDGGVGSGGDGL